MIYGWCDSEIQIEQETSRNLNLFCMLLLPPLPSPPPSPPLTTKSPSALRSERLFCTRLPFITFTGKLKSFCFHSCSVCTIGKLCILSRARIPTRRSYYHWRWMSHGRNPGREQSSGQSRLGRKLAHHGRTTYFRNSSVSTVCAGDATAPSRYFRSAAHGDGGDGKRDGYRIEITRESRAWRDIILEMPRRWCAADACYHLLPLLLYIRVSIYCVRNLEDGYFNEKYTRLTLEFVAFLRRWNITRQNYLIISRIAIFQLATLEERYDIVKEKRSECPLFNRARWKISQGRNWGWIIRRELNER